MVDGDTIDVEIDMGFHIWAKQRLRLARINACELNDKIEALRLKGIEAKAFVVSKCLDKEIIITTHKTDLYGRYVAEVYVEVDGTQQNINDMLLHLGLATIY